MRAISPPVAGSVSVRRIFMPWMSIPAARSRHVRPRPRFQLEPLENRTALSGGLYISPVAVPAEVGSVVASPAMRRDEIGQNDASLAALRTGSADAGTAAPHRGRRCQSDRLRNITPRRAGCNGN